MNQQLSRQRRVGILAICCLSLFLVGLDVTIVNVALPAIGRDLGTGISGLQWIVDAYTVVLASLLTLSGSIGDRFGRKRTFLLGLVVFASASLACGLAPSVGLLVAFRMVQAAGASMLNPVAMAIIANTFTDPRERAQAVGVWAAMFGISFALGPVVGGALVDAVDWRAIFFVNVPVVLVALGLTLRFVPESRAPRPRRFDPLGQLAIMVMLAALTYAIIEAPHRGWSSSATLATFALAALAFVGLILQEGRREEPVIDLRFFASIPFSAAAAIAAVAFACFGGFLFLNTLYLQGARGLSPVVAGLATAPMAVMIIFTSPISGRMLAGRGPRPPLLIAGVGLTVGCAMLIGLGKDTSFAWLLVSYVVIGVGFGFVNAPITATAVSGMPRAQAGVAASVTSTSRQVGQTLGVAVAGAIVNTGGQPTSVTTSWETAWWVLAGLGALVLVLGALAGSERARASAARTAAALNPEAVSL
jgi:EmrB/QacA subfamily drug resistance transporter